MLLRATIGPAQPLLPPIRFWTDLLDAPAAMLYFVRPWYLLLLLAVPLLAWLWLRKRRGTFRYPDTGLFAAMPVGRGRTARVGGASLRRGHSRAARRWRCRGRGSPTSASRVPAEGIAITVLLDVSGSMAAKDFQWQDRAISRLEAAKQALRLFVAGGEGPDGTALDGRPNDLVGVVTFATRPSAPARSRSATPFCSASWSKKSLAPCQASRKRTSATPLPSASIGSRRHGSAAR